ncbi:MAG: GGDEF domain-containing protein [bacterium]|nr:GGDEF domain-containing protein [bacterium]
MSWIVASSYMPGAPLGSILILSLLALLFGYFPVHVSYANVSLGVGFLLAACLMAGPAVGALVAMVISLIWSVTRGMLPWFSYMRGAQLWLQLARGFFATMAGGAVYGLSTLVAFTAYDLQAPLTEVSAATLAACVTLTVGVYILHNLASIAVSLAAGDDVRSYLRTKIPVPALLEFLALPAALLLVVTHVQLGAEAFALLAWFYSMGAFLGWRSWRDRESLRKRLEEMEVLHRAGTALSGTLELGELVRRLHSTLVQVVPAHAMLLLVRDAVGEGIPQVYSFDASGQRGDGDPDWVADTEGRPEGLFAEPDGVFVFVRDLGPGESGDVRLRLDMPAEGLPSDERMRLLETTCRQAGTAFSNARLYRLANTDPLTGVAQRRYFERALRQVSVGDGGFAVFMLDLDWFKRINDAYGHKVGDDVLRDLAGILKGSLRVMDVCARYGGEEFIILLPGSTSPEAAAVAERIRRILDQRTLEIDEHVIRYTASFGVADHHDLGPMADPMGVVWRADTALLEAKRAGRNQVVSYASLAKGVGAR